MLRMKPLALMHQSVKWVSCTGITGGHGYGFVIGHEIASHHIKDLTLGKARNEFRLSRGRMGHSRRDLQDGLEGQWGRIVSSVSACVILCVTLAHLGTAMRPNNTPDAAAFAMPCRVHRTMRTEGRKVIPYLGARFFYGMTAYQP